MILPFHQRGPILEKLTEETLRDWGHLKELLSFCEGKGICIIFLTEFGLYLYIAYYVLVAQRQVGETYLNEKSSRSHQIIRLVCAFPFSG